MPASGASDGAGAVAGAGGGVLASDGSDFSLPDGTYFGDGSAAAQPPPASAAPLQTVALRSTGGSALTLSAAQSAWPDLIGLQAQARAHGVPACIPALCVPHGQR
jgi:hypothetical protein